MAMTPKELGASVLLDQAVPTAEQQQTQAALFSLGFGFVSSVVGKVVTAFRSTLAEAYDDVDTLSCSQVSVEGESRPSASLDGHPFVRLVTFEEEREAILQRALLAGQKFLDIGRTGRDSTAPILHEEVLTDSQSMSLADKTLRSSLVALVQDDVRTAPVSRFTTIDIKLSNGDKVRVNTVWSKCFGNQYVYHIGPYGKTKSETAVLRVLNDTLEGTDIRESQKVLFRIITKRLKNGETLTDDDLLYVNPNLRALEPIALETLRTKLLAMIYLIYNLEITRRPQYEHSEGYKYGAAGKGKTILCCEVMLDAWTKVLTLLQNGALTIEQVFDKNAPYGLPTGKDLRRQSDEDIWDKVVFINRAYMKHMYPKESAIAEAEGCAIVPSTEEIRQRCRLQTTKSMLESPGGCGSYGSPEFSMPKQLYSRRGKKGLKQKKVRRKLVLSGSGHKKGAKGASLKGKESADTSTSMSDSVASVAIGLPVEAIEIENIIPAVSPTFVPAFSAGAKENEESSFAAFLAARAGKDESVKQEGVAMQIADKRPYSDVGSGSDDEWHSSTRLCIRPDRLAL